MPEISCQQITEAVARLCIEANYCLGDDVREALRRAREEEVSPLGREIISELLENADVAEQEQTPLCQDTGLAVVFMRVGQDVHIVDGDVGDSVQEGVRRGYQEGYLRMSLVDKPFSARVNTKDNTPAVIYTEIVRGDRLRITVMPKGGGAENMSALAMLKPADGRSGVVEFVVSAVERAGANPCPPTIVGVGIGGTAEKSMCMAKHSLLREVGQPSVDPEVAELEQEILARVNSLGIGPQGLGGSITALAVHVETHPCHIGSLPVGVNIQCHSARHKELIL